MVRLLCLLVFLSVACYDVQCQYVRNSRPLRPVSVAANPRDVSELNRRISILEREVVALNRKNVALSTMLRQMNATLFSMASAFAASQESKVANLTLRMDTVEANIDIIVDQAGIDLENTELNSFLGNAEAQLIDLQMDPAFEDTEIPTISPETEDITVDQADLLGNALFTLSQQNQKLSSQVAEIQREVGRGQDTGSSAHQPQTDQLENRINQLERLVVSQNAGRQHGSLTSSRVSGSGAQISSATYVGQTEQTAPLTSEEKQALHGILQDVRVGEVSMFSFARTGSLVGTPGKAFAIPYENELSSKGSMFDGTNGTFICQNPGYYFITFTARTFDHKYLGVNLMKNDDSLTAVFSDKHGRNVMQTQSIIIHLDVNDKLWLRMPPSDKFAMHSDQYHLTTFSGFLLYPGDP